MHARNLLIDLSPRIASEFDKDKNPNIKLEELGAWSSKLINWKCSKGHEWAAVVAWRYRKKNGCPYCNNKKVNSENCLSKMYPNIANEWHPTKNTTTPQDVVSGSAKRVWWLCPNNHEWQGEVRHRTGKKKQSCPHCKTLNVTHSELIEEWSDKNIVKPEQVTYGSKINIIWVCKQCNHEWESCINHRTDCCSRGCPKCANKKRSDTMADLLLSGWHVRNSYKNGYYFSQKNNKKLFYRSSYELKAYKKLEVDDNVISYHPEHLKIPYGSSNYIPDIFVVCKDINKIIEIKPKDLVDDKTNKLKFQAAEKFAADNGYEFLIWTQNDLKLYYLEIVDELNYTSRSSLLNYYNKLKKKNKAVFLIYKHEWESRKRQIVSHLDSYDEELKRVFARNCIVEPITKDTCKRFCDLYHIQGSNNLCLQSWGIFHDNKLLGVLSLGRHHRQGQSSVVLDRLCFKHGVRVIGGSTKLFKHAKNWAKDRGIKSILSFSDNRWAIGNIYKNLGFELDCDMYPDYFYIKDGQYISKQSQRKSITNCPEGMTEKQWANSRGLIQVFDAGKKRWIYYLKTKPSPYKTYYETHIATDKMEVWCEYCNEHHYPLRLTAEKNIAKNGKYICERYGGHLAGKKSKKKKENPYADEGKKKCNRCDEVKFFSEFGTDKAKSDGYSTRCKKCRAEVAIQKYREKQGS